MRAQRFSTLWVSGVLVAVIIFAGIVMERGWERAGYASETYEELRIFAEVLAKVKKNYVEETDTTDLIRGAVQGMLAGLDPHSSYMTPEMFKEMQVETKGEFGGLGIQIGIKENRLTVIAPIEDTPAYAAGIQAGDVITEVDGKPTKNLTLMEAVQRMRGPKGTTVTLTVERKNIETPLTFTLTRDTIKIQSIRSRVLEEDIGYIRISQFQESTPEDLAKALHEFEDDKIQGLIVDLRNNPGGLLTAAVGVSEQFLEPGKLIVSIKGRDDRKDEYRSHLSGPPFNRPMIVLVNQGSASASEIVAAAMQDWGKAVILGTTTFGKGSVQTILPLSDGSGLRLTTAKYYTPKGRSIHKIGVKPDIVVDPQSAVVAQASSKTKDEEASEAPTSPHAAVEGPKPGTESAGKKEKSDSTSVPQDDIQLRKAIELLKSWKVFKQLSPAA